MLDGNVQGFAGFVLVVNPDSTGEPAGKRSLQSQVSPGRARVSKAWLVAGVNPVLPSGLKVVFDSKMIRAEAF